MDGGAFVSSFEFVIAHGYFLVFLGMLVEGPIVTAAAAFAAALGLFSLPLVFVLSILGDIIADFLYYGIGYAGRAKFIDRLGGRFGFSRERVEKLERLLHGHSVKTIIALKLSPVIPAPGFMIIGASRLSFKKFAAVCLLVTVPKSLLFIVVGYYFGRYYGAISDYTGPLGLIIGAVLLLSLIIFFYRQASKEIMEKMEEIDKL